MSEKTQQKRLRTPEGDVVYYMNNKMHNWDGPAFLPGGDERKGEYYINGIKYTKDEWEAIKRDGDGLPWYKSGIADARF
jgi:hypothetical protein